MTAVERVKISYSELQELFLREGADDVGFVEVDRAELGDQGNLIKKIYPDTQTIASFVVTLNRPNLMTPLRNLTSFESHQSSDDLDVIQGRLIRVLRDRGISAVRLPKAFPMDFTGMSGLSFVSHKIVAEQAGMGLMGHSRMLLHPRWGSAIFLGSMLLNCTLDKYDQVLTENPCIKCKVCVVACPTGAIGKNGEFDHGVCRTHNYREASPGFLDLVDALVSSPDMKEFGQRFNGAETLSWGQSLLFGTSYKCNNCQAVCPAGTETIAQYQTAPKKYVKYIKDLFVKRPEYVYVTPGSNAEEAVLKNPAKKLRYVGKTNDHSVKN